MYQVEKIKQCEDLINKYQEFSENTIQTIKSHLIELNGGQLEYKTIYDVNISLLNPSFDECRMVLGDMKNRNNNEIKNDDAKKNLEHLQKLNKYGPENPYPHK